MAAEITAAIVEEPELIQSSGGVFEVEFNQQLVFSKKASGRFPDNGEVLAIIHNIQQGMPCQQAQEEAAAAARKPPGFLQWLEDFLKRPK